MPRRLSEVRSNAASMLQLNAALSAAQIGLSKSFRRTNNPDRRGVSLRKIFRGLVFVVIAVIRMRPRLTQTEVAQIKKLYDATGSVYNIAQLVLLMQEAGVHGSEEVCRQALADLRYHDGHLMTFEQFRHAFEHCKRDVISRASRNDDTQDAFTAIGGGDDCIDVERMASAVEEFGLIVDVQSLAAPSSSFPLVAASPLLSRSTTAASPQKRAITFATFANFFEESSTRSKNSKQHVSIVDDSNDDWIDYGSPDWSLPLTNSKNTVVPPSAAWQSAALSNAVHDSFFTTDSTTFDTVQDKDGRGARDSALGAPVVLLSPLHGHQIDQQPQSLASSSYASPPRIGVVPSNVDHSASSHPPPSQLSAVDTRQREHSDASSFSTQTTVTQQSLRDSHPRESASAAAADRSLNDRAETAPTTAANDRTQQTKEGEGERPQLPSVIDSPSPSPSQQPKPLATLQRPHSAMDAKTNSPSKQRTHCSLSSWDDFLQRSQMDIERRKKERVASAPLTRKKNNKREFVVPQVHPCSQCALPQGSFWREYKLERDFYIKCELPSLLPSSTVQADTRRPFIVRPHTAASIHDVPAKLADALTKPQNAVSKRSNVSGASVAIRAAPVSTPLPAQLMPRWLSGGVLAEDAARKCHAQ